MIFTLTPDLTAEAPARAARELGWQEAALMCMAEMNAAGGLERCIRVLIHWNTTRRADEIRHVYIRGAQNLRPERSMLTTTTSQISSHTAEHEVVGSEKS